MEKELNNKNYLKDCFMQKCQDEFESYQNDEESALSKYANICIKNFHFISLGVASIPILLNLASSNNFTFISQLIALFILVFVVSGVLIIRHVINNKGDHRLKLKVFSSLQTSILLAVLLNFGLYIVSDNPHNEILNILVIATLFSIAIQRAIKRNS